MSASNIQVAIKVRPILRKEKEQKQASSWKVAGNSIQLIEGQPDPFYFDHIFDQDVCNQVIFNTMAKQIVDSGLRGFNGTIFAYGQTASGKTYTMMGDEQNPGVMVLATKEIFKEIEKAVDRQFLLRVGYIEIYNEKIYDLLNKSNQDLKIHETPNGDVSVNCSEHIITCEQDLLNCLSQGNKQRKIGETNMNERSSRSHAIFRIIIESRKRDKTDEDSVQISILNLVDLAGSERADQTGATGSRLKEGGHINKSLLFLSCVIKQLAEDKYVNYRDSKLTRILQASLGGNALTAIICTINPTAVEETWSTLSFANRAKVVKNKPQVNEVLTDAAMMKRLEKEIYRLQNELKVEKTKNSQIKVDQLQRRLIEENHKIINSNSSYSMKVTEKRRRTWCPSSIITPLAEENSAKTETYLPQATMASQMPTKLILPKSGMNFTPHITVRDVYYQHQFKEMQCSPSIDEEFIPAEDVCFDDVLTPQASPSHVKVDFQTPTKALQLRTASLTPRLSEKESLQKVERELKELEAFTNLENKLNVEHDTYNTLKYKLENAERVIARYEKEREDFAFIKVEYVEAETNLANCQKRYQEIESKLIEFEKASQLSAEQIVRYEKEVTELKTKISQLEMENREAVSLDFEFQQHKVKSKRRETELLGALEEKQKEINKLERTLQAKTTQALNNSKEELEQISKNLNENETVCVQCKDLQRILAEYKKLTQDFEALNLDCQSLKLNLEKVSTDAESVKLKADYLETENESLKKDAEHLKSLHGTFEEVQQQIASLQEEKCKLESVKIEFEVMSKETANKIAEKINISQEIQTLNTQRDFLAAECDKLSADIAASGSTREELNKLRTENDCLHSELQSIKTKLETAQSDYAALMSENQTKSDNYERLNVEVLSARNQLQTLQNEYREIQHKYEQIQAECNKHEGTIGEIQSEYDSIQNKYQSLQREYEKLENDSVQSIADCDRVQTENENLETEIRELKTKVEEAQRKLLENDTLQLELESLKAEMNRLQMEYDNDLAMKRKSMSPGKESNGIDLNQENAKLKHDLENLQLEFNEMKKEYNDTSTQLVDTIADYETLQADVEKLEAELKHYKESTQLNHLTDDTKEIKMINEQLKTENFNLAKENVEWKKTISSMTKAMREKCDEKEQLVAQLEEAKNESLSSSRSSADNSEQFIQLAQSFVEIEIPIGNGIMRTFQAANTTKSAPGNKMIIGSIGGITRGTFNELRGAIEFAIATDERRSNTEIYDSLEIEENSTSANSCDSLEGTSRQSNDAQINELLEEKSQLFEKLRDLEETISTLRTENRHLVAQLDENQRIFDQLNGEKLHLNTICDENKCKINELNEIISRAECDNKKLIADCEQLKKAVESECAVESVSHEAHAHEDLKRQHEDLSEKLSANERKFAESIQEYETICAELKEQLLAVQSSQVDELGDVLKEQQTTECDKINMDSYCNCEQYRMEISKLKTMVNQMIVELKKFHDGNDASDIPSRAELEKTISELYEQLQACKCVDIQAGLDEETHFLGATECKCQEVQIEIIELKTSLIEKTREFVESTVKFEELNGRYTKLQAEYDDLSRVLGSEQKRSAEMENTVQSLKRTKEECSLLQDTLQSLGENRNDILKEKKSLENKYEALSKKLQVIESQFASSDIDELKNKLGKLEQLNNAIEEEKQTISENLQQFEQEKKNVTEECQILKNSERSLHVQLQKLVQDHELVVRDKEKLERECQLTREELEIIKKEYNVLLIEKQNLQEKYEKLNVQISGQEKLEKECHTATEELEKIKEECKANLLEKKDLHLKYEELKAQMNVVSSEKTRLQVELEDAKQQLEKLKESHQAERTILEARCSSLTIKLDKLSSAKNELQWALDKSKEHSEFLLQQGKNLEEQFNLELCTVRNSNNSMAQQIDELHEKLEKAERDLTEQLEQSNTEKDKLILQLTNNNNSLKTKSSELETKYALLEQQLEVSRQSLSTEVHAKDELIAVLERQLEESNRSVSTEMHLKGVLEKANAERDDLIVQLTNNNNSLATKNSELGEKLAILSNQFDESKKHLTAEVSKLNQLLTEANHIKTTQSSKIEDLTSKVAALGDELKKAQNAVSDRDSLLQKLNQLQTKYDALSVKHANLELTMSSFETELNTARCVVVENTTLTQKVSELQGSLKELQLKCTSLSSSNEQLQSTNQSLVEKLEEAAHHATECKRLHDEIVKLRAEFEKTQVDLSKANEAQKINSAEWESKERSFVEQISKLQSDVASLIAEKKTIQEKLTTAGATSLSKITALEQQILLLQNEQGKNLSKSISPRKEKIDHLMGENHQLKVKNMSLMDKLDSCSKSQNEERRNRRLSTHDERRLQSFWDSNRDVCTMTEPTTTECSCVELDRKLNELKQRLLIRDSQVNTLSMELKNHPLKTENATLKKLINEEESKQQQLRQELKKYKQIVVNRTNESRNCSKCAEVAKRITLNSATQTVECNESESYRKLQNKYEDLKLICRVRHTKIKELEDALSTGKENANDNFSSHHNQQYRQKYELLQKEFKIIQEKYKEAKLLCNMRYEQIQNLSSQQQTGNS